MRILIAADSFKEALSAKEVCEAIREGWQSMAPDDLIHLFPLADGGEGTAMLLTHYREGKSVSMEVKGPLGNNLTATCGISADGATSFLDMASASGLEWVKKEDQTPLKTSTFGTGQQIQKLLEMGVRTIFLGLGGSATHDLGLGMAAALGYRFLDKNHKTVYPTGENLVHLHKILPPESPLPPFELILLSDVTNPLVGPEGAAYTYGRQKGASEEDLILLEKGSLNVGRLLDAFAKAPISKEAGAGAAGGMGAGCMALLDGKIRPGAAFMLQASGFPKALPGADLVITGEGKLDLTSFTGKLLDGIIKESHQHQVPVIALCGQLGVDPETWVQNGLASAFSISAGPATLTESLGKTAALLRQTAASIALLLSRS